MKILILMSLASLVAQASLDTPDLDQETKFHQIYKNYNFNPTSPEAWNSHLSADKPNTYTIQAGDNLWNLSQTLFADPYFWPKIWSLNNEEIQNPHEVKPKQILKFTPGTTGEAPSIEISTTTKEVDNSIDPDEKPEVVLEKAEKSLKPKNSVPPAKLPPSMPNWQLMTYQDPTLDLNLNTLRSKYRAPNPILSHYVADEEVGGVGEIVETEYDYTTATTHQFAVVRLDAASDYKSFVVVKNVDRVPDPEKGKKGYLVQVQGDVEVIEKVNEDKDLYRVKVLHSIYPLEVGDRLVAANLSQYTTDPTEEYGKVESSIVAGTFMLNQSIFSKTATVVLNAGSSQGLAPGQMLKIYKNPAIRNPDTRIRNTGSVIARIKILQTASNMSVALITDSEEEVWVGDSTEPIVR